MGSRFPIKVDPSRVDNATLERAPMRRSGNAHIVACGSWRRVRFMALAIALMLSGLARPVMADESAAGRVEELKKRGNQAMMDLNYADALEAYKAAIAIAPDD